MPRSTSRLQRDCVLLSLDARTRTSVHMLLSCMAIWGNADSLLPGSINVDHAGKGFAHGFLALQVL